MKLLAAAPLVPLGPELRGDDAAWTAARQWEFGRRFLYSWNDGDRLLFLGPAAGRGARVVPGDRRVPGRRAALRDAAAALAAAFLARAQPGRARARRARHDGPGLRTLLLSLDRGRRAPAGARDARRVSLRRRPRHGRGVRHASSRLRSCSACSRVLGCARCSRRGRPDPALGDTRTDAEGESRRRGRRGLLAAVGALACSWCGPATASTRRLSPDPALRAELRRAAARARRPASSASAVAWAGPSAASCPKTTPAGCSSSPSTRPRGPTFLLGERRDSGFPYYFPVTFLLKTPMPAAAARGARALRASRACARRDAFLLWLPVAVYAAATATRGLQIGHRHLLPIYPFLFVAAGEAAAALARLARAEGRVARRRRSRLWYAGGTLLQHPHHLAYFNELAGGPANGWRLLVDSNLDWGQDLKRPRRVDARERRREAEAVLLRHRRPRPTTASTARRCPATRRRTPARITREIRPGDTVAVSATNLQGVYLEPEDRPLMERLRAPHAGGPDRLLDLRLPPGLHLASPRGRMPRAVSARLRTLARQPRARRSSRSRRRLLLLELVARATGSHGAARAGRAAHGRRALDDAPRLLPVEPARLLRDRPATAGERRALPRARAAPLRRDRRAATAGRSSRATTRLRFRETREPDAEARGRRARAGLRRLVRRRPGREGEGHARRPARAPAGRARARALRGAKRRPPRARLPGALGRLRAGPRLRARRRRSTRSR